MLRTIGIALAVGALAASGAAAQDVKVGVVLPLTGGLAPVGKQVQAGIKAYMDKNGANVAGKKIDLIIKDDGGVPDNSKRLAQELIVNEKVGIIGSGLTPSGWPLRCSARLCHQLPGAARLRPHAVDGDPRGRVDHARDRQP